LSTQAILDALRDSIVNFDVEGVKGKVEKALKLGLQPVEIIEKGIGRGMLEVGQRYESGKYFLPELMSAAATTKSAMEVMEPILRRPEGKATLLGTIVIGTVEGDLHDIGKNIAAALLMGAGFDVNDLGIDVAAERFVQEAKARNAKIVAMSALLTTTIPNMGKVTAALKGARLTGVKVLLGGHHVTREFSEQIGADAYANDAMTGVELARGLAGPKHSS
jgi:5-methyltetrahydrofolate--homocysteine methyltransferase